MAPVVVVVVAEAAVVEATGEADMVVAAEAGVGRAVPTSLHHRVLCIYAPYRGLDLASLLTRFPLV